MSLDITCYQNGHGRCAHALKDLFTSVVLGVLLGGRAVRNPTWRNQNLLPWEGVCRELPVRLRDAEYGTVTTLQNNVLPFMGLPFEHYQAVAAMAAALTRGNHLLATTGTYRIQLYQVSNWEEAGLVPIGSFARCLRVLRGIYWGHRWPGVHARNPTTIAIHARRGNVADPAHIYHHSMGNGTRWQAGFYKGLVAGYRAAYPNATISIYTERQNAGDLLPLRNEAGGVFVHQGGAAELPAHFKQMVEADILVPAASGVSTWAAYLNTGTVDLYNSKYIKQFAHRVFPSNFNIK